MVEIPDVARYNGRVVVQGGGGFLVAQLHRKGVVVVVHQARLMLAFFTER